ncbi:non-hydrolyzing UDP-N-acetylglucosamine 2-epimerase [Aestuariispira ectoiniformans]|uniref:non-hydrolyzing UDP-N-acetylglucosamine 2-epimerase n=1 Tax=Aestuariispira ectoiniformans TaxID=2775080 RepID=UPI00223B9D2A|nr:UDP-N-acetylglucosamine 2-epimerase (non-hydrolyzing) [Aestuariispira ectoiniformans]
MAAKVLTVIGARPQFVKAAAVSRCIATQDGLQEVMVHTGQHFDSGMSDIFFEELSIPKPDHYLGVSGGGHGQMTGRMLEQLETVMLEEQPDCVLVYGDTNSTLAGALAASKLLLPIAHVEAGLRSFNRSMPEEINRIMTDHVSRFLFCPTRTSIENLAREGIVEGVHHVGDVMFDATLHAIEKAAEKSTILADLGLDGKEFSLATIHRAENTNTKENLSEIIDYLKRRSNDNAIVLPLHPRTKQAVDRFGLSLSGVHVIEPIGYLDMARLLSCCSDVITDSGGVQKEAYFHRKRCTTLRSETEWGETIEAGWNRLWKAPDGYRDQTEISDYGSGQAAQAIVDYLMRL